MIEETQKKGEGGMGNPYPFFIMISIDDVTDFMYENFENVKTSKGGRHFHARCSLCGDSKKSRTKKRFHLDYKDENGGVYHCFNCDAKGTFLGLYKKLTGKSYRKEYSEDYILSAFDENIKEDHEDIGLTDFSDIIKRDCISSLMEADSIQKKSMIKSLKKFREERMIPEDIKLFVAFQGQYKGRIIIPIFYGDKIIYFQGRRIHDFIEPKYINPKVEKRKIILNKNMFDINKYIIITEGILDAYMVGNQGTTCLGANLDEIFLKEVMGFTKKGVIIAFDNDKKGKRELIEFIRNNKKARKLKYFLMPSDEKDLNEIKVKKGIDDVYQFVVDNSYDFESVLTKNIEEVENDNYKNRKGYSKNRRT